MLIIEDEPLIAMNILLLLEEHGATSSEIAETQDSAVQLAIDRKPAFITADVSLRTGTGPAAVQAIIEQVGHVPVLFITATPEACVGCDPSQIVRKPMNERTVIAAFRSLAAEALARHDDAERRGSRS